MIIYIISHYFNIEIHFKLGFSGDAHANPVRLIPNPYPSPPPTSLFYLIPTNKLAAPVWSVMLYILASPDQHFLDPLHWCTLMGGRGKMPQSQLMRVCS